MNSAENSLQWLAKERGESYVSVELEFVSFERIALGASKVQA